MPSVGPTSVLCFAQEAKLTALARSTNLPQVKASALNSASAWKKQAVEAITRETRETERVNRNKIAQATLMSDHTGI